MHLNFGVLVFFGHYRAAKHLIEVRLQLTRFNQTFAAYRAVERGLYILVEAPLVHIVVAVQENNALPTDSELLQADRARLRQSPLDAHVVLLHWPPIADVASIAMIACLSPTNLAKATLIAVKDPLLFKLVVVKCADGTKVRTEVDLTSNTGR